jgi:hypothetical protein
MPLIARDSGNESSFTPVPPGMHLARCYRIVDLGTQKSEYQGEIKYLHKLMIQFEVHGEDDNGKTLITSKGEPLSISKNYTNMLGEKASLRKDLAGWRGRDFTKEELKGFLLKNILGHWAMLSIAKAIGNNGKEYTNIMSVNPVPAAIKKTGLPQGFNTLAIFSLDEPDMALFETFSRSLKEKIQSAPEWQNRNELANETPLTNNDSVDDDIPF